MSDDLLPWERYSKLQPADVVLASIIDHYPSPVRPYNLDYNPNRSDFGVHTLFRAQVYRLVQPKINSYHDLETWLKAYDSIADGLGFKDDRPDEDTIRRTWEDYYDDALRSQAEQMAEWMQDRLAQMRLETTHLEPDEDDEDEPEVTPEEKRAAVRHIREMLFDQIDFGRASNTTWDREWVLDLFAEMVRELDSMHAALEDRERHGEEAAELRSVQKIIEKRSVDEWVDLFRTIYDQEIEVAQGANYLTDEDENGNKQAYDLYIDDTIIPFFKQEGDIPDGVIGGPKKKGTNWGWHYVTATTHIESGRSVLLDTYPRRDDDDLYDIIREIVNRAEQHITIDEIFMDSEFRKVELLRWLKDEGYTFTLQYPKHGDRIKRKLVTMEGKYDAADYRIKPDNKTTAVDVTLLCEPDYDQVDSDFVFERTESEGGQLGIGDFTGEPAFESIDLHEVDDAFYKGRRAYVTNKDVDGDDLTAEAVINRYKDRWRIETEFRVIKHSFLPETQTRKFNIRAFYWLFSSMLYNGWVLLDAFIRQDHPDVDLQERPLVQARAYTKDLDDMAGE